MKIYETVEEAWGDVFNFFSRCSSALTLICMKLFDVCANKLNSFEM